MSNIRFFIPSYETIPTDLMLYVDDVYVAYKRIDKGFLFDVFLDDEDEAMKIAKKITDQMEREHDGSQYGASWQTVSLKVIPQDDPFKIDTQVEWIYRMEERDDG